MPINLKTVSSLRFENSELREKWNIILEACVNAESEVEHLQDQLETLNLKLADADDTYHGQVSECFRLSAELSSVNTTITRLCKELEWVKSNYAYVMNHKKEQDELINQTKAVVESLRSQLAALKAKEVNSEHLAKQVVKLQGELSKLEMTYCPYQKNKNEFDLPCGTCVKCKLDAAYGIIERTQVNVSLVEKERDDAERAHAFTRNVLEKTTENVKRLESENHSLKRKITDSYECEGSRTGELGAMCGGCLTCLDKQTHYVLEETVKNFKAVKETYDENTIKLEEEISLLSRVVSVQEEAINVIRSSGTFFYG